MRIKGNERETSYTAVALSILFWFLTLLCMMIIFKFSGETGVESSKRSASFIEYLQKLSIFPFVTEYIVRKAAHVMEYSLLTVLAYNAVRFTNMVSPQTSYSQTPVKIIKSDNEMYIVITLWISSFYSAIDEYHQLFINGRNGSIYDFLIDLCGTLFVLCIIRIIYSINLRRRGEYELRYD